MSSLKIGAFQFKATGNLQENIERYNLLKGHLQTRAVENVMTVISVNSITKYQTAPTAVFDPSGDVICEATKSQEELLLYEYIEPEMTYGQKGMVANNRVVMGLNKPL